ncbi:ATPase (AAA+ superfamily)-like protein [Xylanimonas cellulosilytica DSM 15894]|uniref:ATPase (AAA+ superfamily)-like protein n=1 Tax=Xylanimonas cellulosilytica (strain DSM 15894 / JCM 12276 / CECT 5975 / KCTC 9989 / LMG 20990 / NBRC 107835 / XIL07) TaxID=446471 RepID=D1BZS7_XYLCX|nr:DUF4143 domain-containing protein [Xylanimonas cellulosilytica]ACZ32055.1 ATPase (AAA+ superfamily)-like protein [Xylanimonas cellulosilytica DSM 15894]
MGYRRRTIDDALDGLFPHLAAIAIEGAKGVGKTATAAQRVTTVLDLSRGPLQETIAADPDQITAESPPVLIDEWQLVAPVWDAVKRAVDRDSAGAQFLLAGSASADPKARLHSGAGRIVSLPMRPLSMAERGLATPTVSLAELLTGSRPAIGGSSSLTLSNYTDEILASGFPGIRDLPELARETQLDSHLARIVQRDLPEAGVMVRKPRALTAWLAAYGAATATTTTYTSILDAATADEEVKASRATLDAYREHLTRLFILDPVPAWTPAFNPLKRLTKSDKHHLVDPALAAHLVGVGKRGLLHGDGQRVNGATGTWLGALFESLAAQSVRVYADAARAQVGHLRTEEDHREIDLIVEGRDRSVVAIEIKLAATITAKDVRHLNWLDDTLGDRLADKVIVTTGERAYRRPDGVAVIPLALLGP